jgi:Holliday junction resolvase RusA-like endonuclease
MVKRYDICPVPKPRQTRSDRWKKRPCVMRYRAFADQVRAAGVTLPSAEADVRFYIPLAPSTPRHIRAACDEMPHQQRPDCDNLLKALLDAVFKDDSMVYDIRVSKFWTDGPGYIEVET